MNYNSNNNNNQHNGHNMQRNNSNSDEQNINLKQTVKASPSLHQSSRNNIDRYFNKFVFFFSYSVFDSINVK